MLENNVEYKRFIWNLNNTINLNAINKNIIFLCIGTTKIIGDSFGPLVGSILKYELKDYKEIKVVGDLKNTITYNNIEEYMNDIKEKCNNSVIVVLDSALSDRKNIGKIFIQDRGLKYAESLKKKNRIIGNISIKAVVGENYNNPIKNYKSLNKVSKRSIESMSNIVSNGIIEIMNKRRK